MKKVLLLAVVLSTMFSLVSAAASGQTTFTNPDGSVITYTPNASGSTTMVETETDGTINTFSSGNHFVSKGSDGYIFDTTLNSDGSRSTTVTYPGEAPKVLDKIPYNSNMITYNIPNNLTNDVIKFSGLSDFTDKSTNFSVQKTLGNTPFCSVSYGKVTLKQAPWNFMYDPGIPTPSVHIEYCYGASDDINLPTKPAFTLDNSFLNGGNYTAPKVDQVINNTNETATITIVDSNGVISNQQSIEANSSYAYNFVLANPVDFINNYKVVVASASYMTAFPLTVSYLWAALDTKELASYSPCSQIVWVYDPQGQPKTTTTKKILSDIAGTLNLLAAQTHLTFTYSANLSLANKPNVIKYDWKALPNGVSGIGGPNTITTGTLGSSDYARTVSGNIDLSTISSWSDNDLYAGAYPSSSAQMRKVNLKFHGLVPGRQWLIVHETMHALGFDHSLDPKSIMAAINTGESGFTKEDIAGLQYFYPACTK